MCGITLGEGIGFLQLTGKDTDIKERASDHRGPFTDYHLNRCQSDLLLYSKWISDRCWQSGSCVCDSRERPA